MGGHFRLPDASIILIIEVVLTALCSLLLPRRAARNTNTPHSLSGLPVKRTLPSSVPSQFLEFRSVDPSIDSTIPFLKTWQKPTISSKQKRISCSLWDFLGKRKLPAFISSEGKFPENGDGLRIDIPVIGRPGPSWTLGQDLHPIGTLQRFLLKLFPVASKVTPMIDVPICYRLHGTRHRR